ncbi:hypothetical protein GCM10027265_24410 [Jatrophihabitans fulvus]
MSEPIATPPEHARPVEKDRLTKSALGKALSALGLNDLGGRLESVVIAPSEGFVDVHTRNEDNTTTTKRLTIGNLTAGDPGTTSARKRPAGRRCLRGPSQCRHHPAIARSA